MYTLEVRARMAGAAVMVATTLACASFPQIGRLIQPPRFETAEDRASEIRLVGPRSGQPLGGAAVRVWTRVRNPNPFGVTLSTIRATLFLEDTRAADGEFPLGLPLLAQVSLQVEPRERVALIGRNGTGKSTLLRIISGEVSPDSGTVWRQPALRIARLEQDVPLSADRSVFDVVAEGHTHHLEEDEAWLREHHVDLILSRLQLPPDVIVDTLSGGWRRRVLLARALVGQPDVLLLDEPTNHLDIEAITWLEDFLAEYPGAVLLVTHDRSLLQRLATRIIELDRGQLTSWPGDYQNFLQRKDEMLHAEAKHHADFDKKLAQEEIWIRQGIKARRTRNEGRVRALEAMRLQRAKRREVTGKASFSLNEAEKSGQLIIEAKNISHGFGKQPIINNFSTRIMRGDKIGLIGPNGI